MKLTGVVFIVGNYGSGKTEVAVNLAIDQKKKGVDVRVSDLDLVNPYFRTREARETLKSHGIDLVLPPSKYMQADLPILTPEVLGMIRKPSELALMDVGGDDVGATVLGALDDALKGKSPQMLQVVNPNRPYTDTPDGCIRIKSQIENRSKMMVTGLVGNANLIDETRVEDIYAGYLFMENLADQSGIPLKFITVSRSLMDQLDENRIKCPVLSIERQLVPPWKKAGVI